LIGWGEKGVIGQHFRMQAIWNEWCDDPRYTPMPSGHFIPEEAPEVVLTSLQGFLAH
jgi:haloacetate dehalogenase